MTDNECYLRAKEELFPNELLGELTTQEFSRIIQRAQEIKDEQRWRDNERTDAVSI